MEDREANGCFASLVDAILLVCVVPVGSILVWMSFLGALVFRDDHCVSPCDGIPMASVGAAMLTIPAVWLLYGIATLLLGRSVGMVVAGYPKRGVRAAAQRLGDSSRDID